MTPRELWQCPECGERFTTANQWHSCGKFELDPLFDRSQPLVRELFDEFVHLVKALGPVSVIPQKSRIAIQARMRFAALMPQTRTLKGHLVLARRYVDTGLFERVDTYSPGNHVHVFKLETVDQLRNPEFQRLIGQAYRDGIRAGEPPVPGEAP